jgi:type I restriction enzyme R subunit
VDFKELFQDVQNAIAVYSSDELDIDEGSGGDGQQRRIVKDWLCEFLSIRRSRHVRSGTMPLTFHRIIPEAGYSSAEADATFDAEGNRVHTAIIRAAIKKHSGEELDIKPFEADMRRLLNTYVQADPGYGCLEISQFTCR